MLKGVVLQLISSETDFNDAERFLPQTLLWLKFTDYD